jgi:hypothetical protein
MIRQMIAVAAAATLSMLFGTNAQAQTPGRIIINQLSTKCLDVPGTMNMNPGVRLQLWDCEFNGLEPGGKRSDQFWVFGTQGAIRNTLAGFCIDITGPNNGDDLQIRQCNGSAGQVWSVRQDGFIQHLATGKCIDVSGAPGVNSGARLQLWDCEFGNPQTDQRWRW